jgi:asparagine synthase (glutamine-hydrolysing)
MCGIVGAAGRETQTNGLLPLQTRVLRHRGPDASGEWRSADRRVALGHCRLSIIDLSPAGSQPMTDDRGSVEIVFNGEIYNYRELRRGLEQKGHHFRSASDTEVLLKAYREWDTRCLDHINGMFAFAIYDSDRRRLFLARDRAGEKPLFFHKSTGHFAFASELKALMQDASLDRTLDFHALDHYLAYGYVPGELCMLTGVRKLPPAHALTYEVDSDQMTQWRYWSLPAATAESSEPQALVEELEYLLEDAVRRQLVADVPVGILLSGGIDSSLITAMAARTSSGPVRTYNVAFPGHGTFDESAYARMVASHFGTKHTELVAEPASPDLLLDLVRQYDEPVGDSSMIPTYLISRLIRQSCTVALGGDGGDELFGGYLHYARVQKWLAWRAMVPSPVKKLIGNAASLLPSGVRGRNYLRSLSMPDEKSWITPTRQFDVDTRRELAPATRNASGVTPEEYRMAIASAGRTPLQKMMIADFNTYLPEDILVKVDRASMLASLEVRAPFLDYRIIEFAFGKVPDYLRATGDNRKVLLKKLAGRLLPSTLDLTRKQGFSLPMAAWFTGPWGDYMEDVLRAAPPKLYNAKAIDRLLRGKQRNHNAQRLFNLAVLELWRREYKVHIA